GMDRGLAAVVVRVGLPRVVGHYRRAARDPPRDLGLERVVLALPGVAEEVEILRPAEVAATAVGVLHRAGEERPALVLGQRSEADDRRLVVAGGGTVADEPAPGVADVGDLGRDRAR